MQPALGLLACLLAALPLFAAERASEAVRDDDGVVTLRTTVEAVDDRSHTVILRDREGRLVTVYADPEMAEFDRLTVGDEVTLRYVEGTVLQVRKLDDPGGSGGSHGQTHRGSRWTSAGTWADRQFTERVTVKEVDPQDDSLLVEGEDGRSMDLRVEDRSLLKDLHPGDAIEITSTHPVLIGIE